jgi:hypothetical protein
MLFVGAGFGRVGRRHQRAPGVRLCHSSCLASASAACSLVEEVVHQLCAPAQAQFAEDVAEVELDRLVAEEQRLRHLPVGEAGGDGTGHLQFLHGECLHIPGRHLVAWHAVAGRCQFGGGALGPRTCAEQLEDLQGLPERPACVGAASGTS